MKSSFKQLFRRIPAAVYIFVALVVFAALRYDAFLNERNILNVLRQSSVLAIASIGMTLVISSGTIDLSLGMMLIMSGVICVYTCRSLALTLVVITAVSIILGLMKGLIITKVHLAPMITTLAFMFLLRGMVFILNGASSTTLSNSSDSFNFVGKGSVGTIPFPVIVLLVITLLFSVIMRHTTLGRHFYASGGSEESAKMMGIRVDRSRIIAQVLCTVCVGYAGVIMTSRLGAIAPLQGEEYESKAITACVLGGASLAGGSGSIIGTVIGAVILSLISNIFNLQGDIPTAWQKILSGGILIVIVIVQSDVLGQFFKRKFLKKGA